VLLGIRLHPKTPYDSHPSSDSATLVCTSQPDLKASASWALLSQNYTGTATKSYIFAIKSHVHDNVFVKYQVKALVYRFVPDGTKILP